MAGGEGPGLKMWLAVKDPAYVCLPLPGQANVCAPEAAMSTGLPPYNGWCSLDGWCTSCEGSCSSTFVPQQSGGCSSSHKSPSCVGRAQLAAKYTATMQAVWLNGRMHACMQLSRHAMVQLLQGASPPLPLAKDMLHFHLRAFREKAAPRAPSPSSQSQMMECPSGFGSSLPWSPPCSSSAASLWPHSSSGGR